MDDSTLKILGICVTILVALSGWLFVYLNGKATAARSARLERVNRQLRDLYGPLYARLAASNRTWSAFWDKHRPAHGRNYYFGDDVDLSEKELETWRLWMKTVFEPMNAATEEVILKNIDLLESDDIPNAFVDALAHIAAYKAVLNAWEREDYSEYASVNNWPYQELLAVVEPEIKKLRKQQKKLLGG
tara:strand:- start:1007 stop:1570 length:564 start_codon:yes stop_codon:yes gene_type:complete